LKAAWWLGPLVALLLAVAGAFGVHAWNAHVRAQGYAAGELAERAVWKTQQDIDRLVLEARRADDQRLATQLVEAGRAEATAAQAFATRLQTELRRARNHLVVSECVVGPGGPAGAGATADVGAGPGVAAGGGHGAEPGTGDAAAAGGAAGGGFKPRGFAALPAELRADAGVVLSADAVRLWDSALAGRHMPASACGAAGQPASACAAATSYTLEDAWANLAANAASCRADRGQHQRLIDFVLSRQMPGSAP
jgi:hypothetical protein